MRLMEEGKEVKNSREAPILGTAESRESGHQYMTQDLKSLEFSYSLHVEYKLVGLS